MMRQRILWTCLVVAVVSMVMDSGNADARCCRNRCGFRRGCGSGCGYGYSGGCNTGCNTGCGEISNGCGTTGCGTSGCGVNGCSAGMYWNGSSYTNAPVNNGMAPTPVNGQILQSNGTYSTAKPTYNYDGTINNGVAPANPPVYNTAPAPGVAPAPAPASSAIDANSSPDVDNEGRNASRIQGTAPTKAPAPAANANP